MAENASLKEELSARRQEQQQTYVPKPLDLSEYKTRKLYIDAMLQDAGWREGENWLNEVPVEGMPNKSETGRIDYVLYDDMHQPLAIIEADVYKRQGYIRRSGEFWRLYHLNEIVSNRNTKNNISYALQLSDYYNFVLNRFYIWGSIETMFYKNAFVNIISIVEALILESANQIDVYKRQE